MIYAFSPSIALPPSLPHRQTHTPSLILSFCLFTHFLFIVSPASCSLCLVALHALFAVSLKRWNVTYLPASQNSLKSLFMRAEIGLPSLFLN